MKKWMLLIVALLTVCLLTACGCEHEWEEADCNDPKTCKLCGETEGEDLGHDYVDANCESPRTCSRCGKEKGDALGHSWVEADCENPRHCEVCQKTEGEALGHNAPEATCEEASVCNTCGKELSAALGHNAPAATCTEPGICANCSQVINPALGHSWVEATEEAPKTCTVCGLTEGEPLKPTVANLGYSYTEFADLMDQTLSVLGYSMVYIGEEDGTVVYEVYDVVSGTGLEVYVGLYLDADGSTVYGVFGTAVYTETDNKAEIAGNCLGAAAVLADPSFSNEDLTLLLASPQIGEDGSISYFYYKNSLEFAMAFAPISDGEAEIVWAIGPEE